MSMRDEIKKGTARIEDFDTDVLLFCNSNTAQEGFWLSVARILRRTGFEESTVRSTFFDVVTEFRSADPKISTSEMTKTIIDLSSFAVTQVYEVDKINFALHIAKNPILYLVSMKNKGFSAEDAMSDLMTVRRQIGTYLRNNPTVTIEQSDTDFTAMYRASDSEVEYYRALFTLIKNAGYSKDDIVSAMMSPTILPKAGNDVVKTFLKLANTALTEVFVEKK